MFAASSSRVYMAPTDPPFRVKVLEEGRRYTLIIESADITPLTLCDFSVSATLDQLERLVQDIAERVADQRRFEQLMLQDEALAMREHDA